MAHFLLTYGYNDTPLRAEKRPDHLAHLAKLEAEGSVLLAGPWPTSPAASSCCPPPTAPPLRPWWIRTPTPSWT